MKKIVISGSSKLQNKVKYWVNYFEEKGYEIIDYPREVSFPQFNQVFPSVFKEFYINLERTDIYFLMNEKKNGIEGYIGASGIAELTYVVIQNLIHHKNIEIYILNMPSPEVSCYDEVKFWLDMGWIKLFQDSNND